MVEVRIQVEKKISDSDLQDRNAGKSFRKIVVIFFLNIISSFGSD